MLQDRRCREWSSPVSLFLARASFNILVRIISIKFIYGTHHKLIGADGVTRYCGEADDVDNPSSALSASLIPLFTEGRVIAHHGTSTLPSYISVSTYPPQPPFVRSRSLTVSSHQSTSSQLQQSLSQYNYLNFPSQ